MVTIIGGAYQGKLEHALSFYSLSEADVFNCEIDTISIDTSKKIIYKLELFILALIRSEIDPVSYIESLLNDLTDSIIICDDITCSVVPVSAEERKWREGVGRVLTLLGKHSDVLTRLFCGIATNIKG